MKPGKKTRIRQSLEEEAVSYRLPMAVTELIFFHNRCSHYRCPRCGISLEREFAAYCDRCGQRLNWRQYKKAKHIIL